MNTSTRTRLRRTLLLAFPSVVLLYFGTTALGDSSDESQDYRDATEVAQTRYQDFLRRALTPYSKARHGLDIDDDPDKAVLGAPYLIHEIVPSKVDLCSDQACDSASDISAPIDVYVFPVMFGGRAKLILTVYRNQETGELEIGSLGEGWLARELETIREQWPAKTHPIMLFKSNQARVYAFSIPSLNKQNLTLIDPEKGYGGMSGYGTLTDIKTVLPTLKAKIAHGMKGPYH